MPVFVTFTVSPRDFDRTVKHLDKWQGAPLAKRLDKALQAGLKLLIGPFRAGAARHTITGKTAATMAVKRLRKRPGEAAAYKAGVTTWYGHFPISGTSRGVKADPYIDRAVQANQGRVLAFIDEQVTRLA